MSMEDPKPPHVVLFPFLAQGHFAPFLALAELIHRRYTTCTLTLVSTPLNVQNLRSSIPPTSPIRLRALPFSPSAHGLPSNAESTADIPFHLFINLFQASEALQPAFDQLIADIIQEEGRPSLCIIADHFLGWTVHVARRHGVFHSIFVTSGAYGTAVYFSLWTHLPHTLTTSDEFSLPEFPDTRIHRSQLPKHLLVADGGDSWSVFLQRQISLCSETDAVLANTVEEFETAGLRMLRRIIGVPVRPIGPLLRPPASPSSSTADKNFIMQWLDLQPPRSVLYISFGSQNTVAASQMMELAMGLEASGRPFIWAIRPPAGFDVRSEFRSDWLPEAFEERMGERKVGMLVHGWAPQLEILSHRSTGAFLSHCGWNSVLESLSRGVPIVGWPLTADQLYNSKMLAEMVGVSVEVARTNMECARVERVEVARMVEMVMGETAKGREMRRRAEEIREMMMGAWREGVGSSVRGLEEFFRAVGSMRKAS
ncbi:UDP-glycosyltransferase 92A1-like [Phoenix dactylifera]|uniref:Glycosyltransferase n=1 Tax=Phoenix dactylifera TaxID=42345 RepID=A0A8B7CX98_PHODC|nr:UDP-glycosyltransferase 92A1-like [Phoenix dactylifera]